MKFSISGCKKIYYCSKNCLKQGWKSHHSKECEFLKQVSEDDLQDLDFERMVVRTIIRLQNHGHEIYDELPNGRRRYFKDLMSHKTELAKDSRMKLLSHIYNLLQISFESAGMKDILPSKSEVLEIWGRLLVNQFDITLQIGK